MSIYHLPLSSPTSKPSQIPSLTFKTMDSFYLDELSETLNFLKNKQYVITKFSLGISFYLFSYYSVCFPYFILVLLKKKSEEKVITKPLKTLATLYNYHFFVANNNLNTYFLFQWMKSADISNVLCNHKS